MPPKQHRLKRKDVVDVFKKGKSFSSNNFILKTAPRDSVKSAFAFIVQSKTTKKAMERNKLKRRVRNIIKNLLPFVVNNIGVVVFIKKSLLGANYKETNDELVNLFKKARILK